MTQRKLMTIKDIRNEFLSALSIISSGIKQLLIKKQFIKINRLIISRFRINGLAD